MKIKSSKKKYPYEIHFGPIIIIKNGKCIVQEIPDGIPQQIWECPECNYPNHIMIS